jgi:large subunit ribosomal protein L29
MKTKELREKNSNELNNDLIELKNTAQRLMFDISIRQAKNNRSLRNTKKDIARILTVLREKNNIQ